MDIQEIINQMNFVNFAWQIVTPLCFSLADVITGIIQAIINNDLDSKKMREGLLRKCLLIVIILLSFLVRFAFNLPAISQVICSYIILMECVSIMENLTKAGIDLGKLAEILKLSNKEENK